MTSAIDITKPETGAATTASVRGNFSTAKTEIEALQAAVTAEVANRIADVNAEESARIGAVSAEATTRGDADSAEALARSNADIALDARLDALETTYSAALAANVAMTTSNTWYDGPSISLPAGKFQINGSITANRTTTTAGNIFGRITTGTVHFASTQGYFPSVNPNSQHLAMSAIVTLASPTTIKLQGTLSAGSASHVMLAAMTANGSGNNATQITAQRIT